MLEEADYQANAEEERDYAINTRATANRERFQTEYAADRYAEYVAMGWREPEPQDIGKVVFNRSHRRTEANLIRAELSYAKHICPDMLEKWAWQSRPTSTSIRR